MNDNKLWAQRFDDGLFEALLMPEGGRNRVGSDGANGIDISANCRPTAHCGLADSPEGTREGE